jgi:D-tyrosyl-tRNA(Tyr) deacylase
MRCVIQRVKEASVKVEKIQKGAIHTGFVIYVGFHKDDDINAIDFAVEKIIKLRIFDDEFGKMNMAIDAKKSSILLISQFTLYGNTKGTNRPSFSDAMSFEKAEKYYYLLLEKLNHYIHTIPGAFGQHMEIFSVNDGPVTIILEF